VCVCLRARRACIVFAYGAAPRYTRFDTTDWTLVGKRSTNGGGDDDINERSVLAAGPRNPATRRQAGGWGGGGGGDGDIGSGSTVASVRPIVERSKGATPRSHTHTHTHTRTLTVSNDLRRVWVGAVVGFVGAAFRVGARWRMRARGVLCARDIGERRRHHARRLSLVRLVRPSTTTPPVGRL